jgi:hypothetical protein
VHPIHLLELLTHANTWNVSGSCAPDATVLVGNALQQLCSYRRTAHTTVRADLKSLKIAVSSLRNSCDQVARSLCDEYLAQLLDAGHTYFQGLALQLKVEACQNRSDEKYHS